MGRASSNTPIPGMHRVGVMYTPGIAGTLYEILISVTHNLNEWRIFMSKRIKNVLFVIIVGSLILGLAFRMNHFVYLFIVLTYAAMFIYELIDARTNFLKCLKYFIFSTPFFSLIVVGLISSSGIIDNMFINNDSYLFSSKSAVEYLMLEVFYFIFWLIMIVVGDLKTVKMATLVVAQIMTVVFVILNIIIYLQPTSFFNGLANFSSEEINLLLEIYGYDMRKLTELVIQLLFAPILIVAILSNLLSEIKTHFQKKDVDLEQV